MLHGFDIHVRKGPYVKVNPSAVPPQEVKPSQIIPLAEVKPGLREITVEGFMVEPPNVKEVTLRDGSKVKVAEFTLRDASGTLKVSAWREHGEILAKLPTGLKIRLKGVNVKECFTGQIEASTTSSTTIEVIPATGEAEEA